MSQSTPPPVQPQPLPYASSVIPLPSVAWRKGDRLITPTLVELPPTCIKCDAPGAKRYRKDVYWHQPLIYLTILAGILIYAIVALAVRKKATYVCSLCETHGKVRERSVLITWGVALSGLAMVVVGVMASASSFGPEWQSLGWLILIGSITMIGAGVFAAIKLPLLKPKFVDSQYAHYAGATDSFLRHFSEV